MPGFDVKLTGVDALRRNLKRLPEDLHRGQVQFGLRKAGDVIRDAARQNAARLDDPATPTNIAANIVTRSSSRGFKRYGNLRARVGVLGGAQAPDTTAKQRRRVRTGARSLASLGELSGAGKGNPGGDTFYWRFLEFGHIARDKVTHVAARPFMRPAMDSGAQPALTTFAAEMNKSIDRAVKRLEKSKN